MPNLMNKSLNSCVVLQRSLSVTCIRPIYSIYRLVFIPNMLPSDGVRESEIDLTWLSSAQFGWVCTKCTLFYVHLDVPCAHCCKCILNNAHQKNGQVPIFLFGPSEISFKSKFVAEKSVKIVHVDQCHIWANTQWGSKCPFNLRKVASKSLTNHRFELIWTQCWHHMDSRSLYLPSIIISCFISFDFFCAFVIQTIPFINHGPKWCTRSPR